MIASILAYVVVLVLLGLYAFYCLRTDGWRKYTSAAGYTLICAAAYFGFMQSLGNAIPTWALLNKGEMAVLNVYMQEGEAIYVYGFIEGEKAPKTVVLPWSDEKAEQFSLELNEARKKMGTLDLKWEKEEKKSAQGDQTEEDDPPYLEFVPTELLQKEVEQ